MLFSKVNVILPLFSFAGGAHSHRILPNESSAWMVLQRLILSAVLTLVVVTALATYAQLSYATRDDDHSKWGCNHGQGIVS